MGWRSRWCWQTRMQSQTRWCQWCKCRDSCRQGHPHRRLAPPSARPVPAKTASTGCFLQQDWEWCPQSKASPSRQGPRARKRAHVRRSEPCCKFCQHRELHRSGLQRGQAESSWNKLKPKSSRSPMWIQTRQEQHTDTHVCFELIWIGNYQPMSPKYLTSCDAHMWSCATNNISSSPKWDSFGWSFCIPNKHALNPGPTMTHCKEDMSAWKTCPVPIHICSLKDAMSAPIRRVTCSVRDNKSILQT